MALSSVNIISILSLTINVLLQVVSCHLQNELQEGFQKASTWDSLSHAKTLAQSVERSDNSSTPGSYRDSKFANPASLFTMVQFSNAECENSASLLRGTCYTVWDCLTGILTGDLTNTDTSISTSGSCQQGFGICCTSILGCGGFSSNNNTYLRSPGYPETFNSAMDCDQTIVIEDNICQLKMNIEDLSLDTPDGTGNCATDYLKVNQDRKFEFLCGITKNNHFYLDVDYWDNPNVIFSFHTDASTSADRSWSIRITKIECNSDEEVPRGCGQYYTGTTGTIKGINYEGPSSDDYVLSGMNYGICIRMELGYCKNTYTEYRTSVFIPQCPDVLEKPGRFEGEALNGGRTNNKKCTNSATTGLDQSETYLYLTPHQYKLDTTRSTTNTHRNSDANNHGGNYYYDYSQTKCT